MAKPIEQEIEKAFDVDYMTFATNIDEPHLNDHFMRLSGDLAYYNGVYAQSIELYRKAERELEFGEAEIRLEYRATPSGQTTKDGRAKPITEGAIDDCLKTDHRYRKLREDVDAAEVLKARVSGIVDAIRAKREMLVTIGANMRAEHKPTTLNERPTLQDKERRAGITE